MGSESVIRKDLQRQLRRARALNKIAHIISQDKDLSHLRDTMVRIIGETLDVDRMLIYDVCYENELAQGLCEWLNPNTEDIQPTLATYPLAVFRAGADHTREHGWMESHADDVHSAMIEDGSGEILHGAMNISSLLWFAFDIEPSRFFALIFNQVRGKRTWSEEDRSFVEDVGELVSMAHLRLRFESHRNAKRRRLEQRTRLEGLGLLAGGVAHDFNNLLTVIIGNASFLRRLEGHSVTGKQLKSIEVAATSAAEMCKQLLTYSGVQGRVLSPVDVNVLLLETVSVMETQVPGVIRTEISDVPLWVNGDRAQLRQLILNLVTNASDALSQGGIITVKSGYMTTEQVRLKMGVEMAENQEKNLPFFVIEDTGCGMDEQTQERIFEPFYTTKGSGHGLGLAAVHGVIEGHGAGLKVESEDGEGTCISVVFPPMQGRPKPAPAVGSTEAEGNRKVVLVVDDELMVRSVCESALTLAGYEVISTVSGEEALTICADPQVTLDMVLLDIALPGIDGRQTLRAMRQGSYQVPAILMSAYPPGIPEGDPDYGNFRFLQKPFRPEELLITAEVMLEMA